MTAEEAAWVRQALAADPAQRPTGTAVTWVRELVKRLQAAAAKPPVTIAEAPPPAAPTALAPGATAFPSSGVLLIEGDRRQPVATLAEALAIASDGAEIRLAAGEHRLAKPVELKTSLTLIGPGPEQCRVTCDGEVYVIRYSGKGTFAARGIRFEHIGSQAADVLRIASGQIDLENCICRGAVWDESRKWGGDGLWARLPE